MKMTKKPSQYEKMLAGEPYFGIDEELINMGEQAQTRLKAYRKIDDEDKDAKQKALSNIFGSLGEHTVIAEPFYIDFGIHTHIGNGFINMGCTFLDGNKITIGDFTLIGPHVQLLASGHPANPDERIPDNLEDFFMGKAEADDFNTNIAKPITIGEKCWIGGGAIVMGGVTIGDGTTIGAGSVVTKDIPARCVAVGNPARVIRYFDD
jgi:maltose O-acetyltransferase